MRIFAHGDDFSWQAQGKPRVLVVSSRLFVTGARDQSGFISKRRFRGRCNGRDLRAALTSWNRSFWTCGSFADFVAGVNLAVQISWQVQHFVNLEVQIS